MDNKIRKLIDTLLAQAEKEGFVEAEAYYESESSTSVQAFQGEIIQFESSDTEALSFRGLYNGQMGYSFSSDLTEEAIPFLLTQAKENCEILEVKEKVTVFEGEKEYPEFDGFNEELTKIGYDELAKAALDAEKETLAYDSRIESVDECFAEYSFGELLICNSKGMICESRENDFEIAIGCRAKENDDVQTAAKSWSFNSYEEFDAKKYAAIVGEKVISKLGAKTIPSIKTPIVLDRAAARRLLSSFAGSFSADAMHKGLSRLAGRIGETIANKAITLIDEGMIEGSPLCIPFDSEGVAAKRTVLIDQGVFRSALHNRKTALVDGVESTGNGFRSSVQGAIGISSSNLHFAKGPYTLEDLFAKMGNGVYITGIDGLHAGINGVSGDFSLMAEGFKIRDGKKAEPINQITIADNFFDILMKVEDLADDVDYFAPDSYHCQSPSLLIPDVSVSGE